MSGTSGDGADKPKTAIQILRGRQGPVPPQKMEGVKQVKKIHKAIKAALKEGPGTPPEIAERTGLPVREVFFHLAALCKYHQAEYVKEDYADYFQYRLPEGA